MTTSNTDTKSVAVEVRAALESLSNIDRAAALYSRYVGQQWNGTKLESKTSSTAYYVAGVRFSIVKHSDTKFECVGMIPTTTWNAKGHPRAYAIRSNGIATTFEKCERYAFMRLGTWIANVVADRESVEAPSNTAKLSSYEAKLRELGINPDEL